MKTATFGLFLIMSACLACACGGGGKPADNKPASGGSDTVRLPVPQQYGDMKPTTPLDDAAFIEKGKELYNDPTKANCVQCHGAGGKGDGILAPNYSKPKVADLTTAGFQDAVTDQYIFWRIRDVQGSKAEKDSAMLGYPNGSDEETWSLVAYVRALKGK